MSHGIRKIHIRSLSWLAAIRMLSLSPLYFRVNVSEVLTSISFFPSLLPFPNLYSIVEMIAHVRIWQELHTTIRIWTVSFWFGFNSNTISGSNEWSYFEIISWGCITIVGVKLKSSVEAYREESVTPSTYHTSTRNKSETCKLYQLSFFGNREWPFTTQLHSQNF